MSASFNKVMLMGNLTRDPHVKQLPSNSTLVEFGLAVSRKFKTAAGEDREEVAFVDCTAFGRQAETIAQYCTKGKPLFIEGRLKYDTWEDKQGGGKRSKLTVIVEHFQFLPGNNGAPHAARATGSRDAALEGAFPPDAAKASFPARAGWRGRGDDKPAPRAPAEKPFGNEPQFAEADIPF